MQKLLRGDVSEHALAALEKFIDAGYHDNFTLMEPLVKQINWFSEDKVAIHRILLQKLRYATGGGKGAEYNLKEMLELSRFSNWKQTQRVAVRALSGMSPK